MPKSPRSTDDLRRYAASAPKLPKLDLTVTPLPQLYGVSVTMIGFQTAMFPLSIGAARRHAKRLLKVADEMSALKIANGQALTDDDQNEAI